MKRKKAKSGAIRLLIEVIICVIVVVVVYKVGKAGFDYAKGTSKNQIESEKQAVIGEAVSVTIPQGASTSNIANLLEEKGLIEGTFMFRMKSKFGDYDGTYKHGTYSITQGLEDEEIMMLLQQGAIDESQIKITIPEGYTAKQIGTLLEENGVVSLSEFLEAANSYEYDYEFVKELSKREVMLEGYLFPDTYFFEEGSNGHDVVDKMLERFNQFYGEEYKSMIEKSKSIYSLDEIVTIASIIEAEIQMPNERKIASGVIYNRLEKDMKLQMCSTVLYALGKRRDVLLLEDLEVESPYNTYINEGLPAGPISNPGEAALDAAFYPEDNNYLYFVLKAEAQGEHVFTETYDEFLAAKEKYKQQF